jgi:hypothetical protein
MKELGKPIVKILGYAFFLLVLGFTGYQTFSLLYEVTRSMIMAAIGLVLFEGGMLYWWMVFQREAKGLGQMAVSLLTAVLGLLVVIAATAMHLGAWEVGADSPTAARLITIAAILNLIAKFAYPLLDPDKAQEILKNAIQGKVLQLAYAKFQEVSDNRNMALAEELAEQWQLELQHQIRGENLPLGLNQIIEGEMVGEEAPATTAAPSPPPTPRPVATPAPTPEPVYSANGASGANFTQRP